MGMAVLSVASIGHHDSPTRREHAADAVTHGDLDVFHLRRSRAADLTHRLLQCEHAVHAGVRVAPAAAVGVERELAARGGVTLRDERRTLAAPDKTEIFEP